MATRNPEKKYSLPLRLDKRELFGCIPMRNYVITTTVMKEDVIKLGDKELYIDTSFDKIKHQPICQRVVRVPKRLIFGKVIRFADFGSDDPKERSSQVLPVAQPIPGSMEWLTDMDVKVDDTIYVNSLSLFNADRENRLIECEGVKYYMVAYGDIYFKLVNGEPEMLNGWVGCEPIENEENDIVKRLKATGFVFPSLNVTADNRRERGVEDKLATVKYLGLPVKKYLDESQEESDVVSVGDVVVLKWGANRRLEFEAGRFFGKTELIITRRTRIVGVMKEELFDD